MATAQINKRDQTNAGFTPSGNPPPPKFSKDDADDLPPLEGQFALLMMHLDKKVDKKIDRLEGKIDNTQSSVDDLSSRVAALESERQKMKQQSAWPRRGSFTTSQTAASSTMQPGPTENDEWKALIVGFDEDTQAKHIDCALKKLEEVMKATGVTNRHARGGRSTSGFIKFEDKESMAKFIKDTKKIAPITIVCNEKEVKLEAKVFRTKEEKAETKEIRTLAYVIRQQMGFTGQDKDVLDISFQNQAVLVNNVRVAQFLDKSKERIKGKIDKNIHTFTIDEEKLAEHAQAASYPVDPQAVHSAYLTALRE
jgi:hypothetical protein